MTFIFDTHSAIALTFVMLYSWFKLNPQAELHVLNSVGESIEDAAQKTIKDEKKKTGVQVNTHSFQLFISPSFRTDRLLSRC